MPLNHALAAVLTSVPDCLAATLIDLAEGRWLAVRTLDDVEPEVLDLMVAASAELFENYQLEAAEALYREACKPPLEQRDDCRPREAVVLSRGLTHLFIRNPECPRFVLLCICRAGTSLGLALARSRQAVARLTAA